MSKYWTTAKYKNSVIAKELYTVGIARLMLFVLSCSFYLQSIDAPSKNFYL